MKYVIFWIISHDSREGNHLIKKKFMLVSILSCLLLFFLQACNGSEQPVSEPEVNDNQQTKPIENEAEVEPTKTAVNDNDRKAIGRDLLTKYSVNYYMFTTPEEFEEGFLNDLFDMSMQEHPIYSALKHFHPDDVKKFSKAEIDKIENESVEPREEGGFIYKATVTDKVFYKEIQKEDQPFYYRKYDYELHINQDAKGEYKIFDISSKDRIYFPDM